jgi:hypothetical protein
MSVFVMAINRLDECRRRYFTYRSGIWKSDLWIKFNNT